MKREYVVEQVDRDGLDLVTVLKNENGHRAMLPVRFTPAMMAYLERETLNVDDVITCHGLRLVDNGEDAFPHYVVIPLDHALT